MNIREIRGKNREEIEGLLRENREALREARFAIASRESKNHQEYRHLRRDIARVLTVLREHE